MNYRRFTAPCGIDCFNCQLFDANAQSPEKLALNKARPELTNVACKGCRDQNCALLPGPCPTRECVQHRGFEFCYECFQFPCDRLAPVADRAAKVPQNIKVFNLCRIKAVGIESWGAEEADAIRERYFKGRFQIGAGPQLKS